MDPLKRIELISCNVDLIPQAWQDGHVFPVTVTLSPAFLAVSTTTTTKIDLYPRVSPCPAGCTLGATDACIASSTLMEEHSQSSLFLSLYSLSSREKET